MMHSHREAPMTQWAQNLVQMQEEFEDRMHKLNRHYRKKEFSSESHDATPWAMELTRIQTFFENWDANIAQTYGKHVDGTTAWGQSLVDLQDEFETHMQSREGSSPDKAVTTS